MNFLRSHFAVFLTSLCFGCAQSPNGASGGPTGSGSGGVVPLSYPTGLFTVHSIENSDGTSTSPGGAGAWIWLGQTSMGGYTPSAVGNPFSARSGCLVIQGTYSVNGSQIAYSNMTSSTIANCNSNTQAFDSQFITAISSISSSTINLAQRSLEVDTNTYFQKIGLTCPQPD